MFAREQNWAPATAPNGEEEERKMLTLKNCRRCNGDMQTNRDVYGSYAECLQCGHMEYLKDPQTPHAGMKRRSKKPAAA